MQNKIKAFVTDVDGVWTDGSLWLGDNGQWRRHFYIHDGLGLLNLQKAGIRVAVISGSKTEDIELRCKVLKIEKYFLGVGDKKPVFLDLLKDWNLKPEEVAYVGDDIIDTGILDIVGLPFTVPNAHRSLLNNKKYKCTEFAGGRGAVREICDHLLENHK
ncbi:MAG: HAD hydrolase-like protein [Bdellovibrionales bacterium]|nr:HAD hydrolase-like protein [Bdellovibrionales bacterium]